MNGAYVSEGSGTVLVSEQVNCKYIGIQLRTPAAYNLPGKSIKYTSMQIVEATKHIKAGNEYFVSYGSEYKSLYLQGKSGKADENHDPNAGGSEAAEEASLAFTATHIKRRKREHASTV